MWLALPSSDTIDLGGPAAHFCFDLLTELALGPRGNRLHDELHATCFANSVLLGAMLSEVTPLPIATCEAMLIVETHVSHLNAGLSNVWSLSAHRSALWLIASVKHTCHCAVRVPDLLDWPSCRSNYVGSVQGSYQFRQPRTPTRWLAGS